MSLRKLWLVVPCALCMNLLFFCGVRGEMTVGGMNGVPGPCGAAAGIDITGRVADLMQCEKAFIDWAGASGVPVLRQPVFDPALVRLMAGMG